jgi:predicted Fe-S protein YdhL (DUF1289 family)
MKAKPRRTGPADEAMPSPCVGACRMEGEYCVGCYRTIDEIIGWISASADERRAILAVAEERRRRLAGNAGPPADRKD